MWRFIIGILGVIALAIAINLISVAVPMRAALEHRDGISAIGYYQYGFFPRRIVFDLWGADGPTSTADVLGGFFGFSEQMKDREFDAVILAYRGEMKFMISGNDFLEIGRTWSYQNPIYLLRTFPEKLQTMDGHPAYSTWSGGWLGVANAQLQDVNDFADAWFREDL